MSFSRVAAFIKRLTGNSGFKVEERFKKIYEENIFLGTESRSGTGASLAQTERLRQELPQLLAELGVKRFLDAPCGDCHWIAELDWGTIDYTGADVVADLIQANRTRFADRKMRFIIANLCVDDLPPADLIFCRDCWVHLDYRQIRDCFRNFQRSGATYLLTTTFTSPARNRDLGGAIWRPLNLQIAPFFFPAPIKLCVEGCTENGGAYADKALGLWRLKDITF
jgi:SAM-dependent methyltransferase